MKNEERCLKLLQTEVDKELGKLMMLTNEEMQIVTEDVTSVADYIASSKSSFEDLMFYSRELKKFRKGLKPLIDKVKGKEK